jgi:MYXO-CTERM domain-containing protein
MLLLIRHRGVLAAVSLVSTSSTIAYSTPHPDSTVRGERDAWGNWGVLGLLGLFGLVGRTRRHRRLQDAAPSVNDLD